MNRDDVWINLVYAFKTNSKDFPTKVVEFKSFDSQWFEYLKEKLFGKDRLVAFSVLETLTDGELKIIFDTLIYYASYTHGNTKFFRELILRLPNEWVIENIQRFTNPILENGTEDEYRRILDLFYMLNTNVTLALAKRALQNSDPGIKEVGDDFLKLIESGS